MMLFVAIVASTLNIVLAIYMLLLVIIAIVAITLPSLLEPFLATHVVTIVVTR